MKRKVTIRPTGPYVIDYGDRLIGIEGEFDIEVEECPVYVLIKAGPGSWTLADPSGKLEVGDWIVFDTGFGPKVGEIGKVGVSPIGHSHMGRIIGRLEEVPL